MGGISGGRSSSSKGGNTGEGFGEAALISTSLGGLVARAPENETGAGAAGFEVTVKAAGAAASFAGVGEIAFGTTGAGSATTSDGPGTVGFPSAGVGSASAGIGAGTKPSAFLDTFPCLPALTTFGAEEPPGEAAKGDSKGEQGEETRGETTVGERGLEAVDFGEVGEEEEADIEERFLLPGTAFGAEEL